MGDGSVGFRRALGQVFGGCLFVLNFTPSPPEKNLKFVAHLSTNERKYYNQKG